MSVINIVAGRVIRGWSVGGLRMFIIMPLGRLAGPGRMCRLSRGCEEGEGRVTMTVTVMAVGGRCGSKVERAELGL